MIGSFVIQISTHIRRIETVEKNLKALSEASATKEDSKKSKAELKKLYVSPDAPGVQLFKERKVKKHDALTLSLSLLLAAATAWAILLCAYDRMVSMSVRSQGFVWQVPCRIYINTSLSLSPEFLDLRAHVWGMRTSINPCFRDEDR